MASIPSFYEFNHSLTFKFSKNESIQVNLQRGKYQFECWGAKGNSELAGNGAYTKGEINLKTEKTFYLFIGERGKYRYQYSFNGGGASQYGGGGASDIRTVNGNCDDFESLKFRIMVAAGGGGPDSGKKGGAGGKLGGLESQGGYGKGGTQTSGGIGCGNGTFGQGGSHISSGFYGNGAGGSGYYGGGTSQDCGNFGGGGGSSFISGHPGCNAIKESSKDINNIEPSNTPFHYSGLYFTNTIMIDGEHEMPSPNGGFDLFGHADDGAIRIIYLGRLITCIQKTIIRTIPLLYIYIFSS